MKNHLQSGFLCGALALTGLMAAVGPADAAVYRGTFHPTYGPPFESPALGWSGSLQVTVNDSCVSPNGSANLISCPGGIQINEAKVNLFEVNGNGDQVGGVQQVLDFGATSGVLGLGWLLNFDSNKNLKSANSTAFAALEGAAGDLTSWEDPANVEQGQAWFSLQFLGNYAQLYWFENKPSTIELLNLTDPFAFNGTCRENNGVDGLTTISPISAFGHIVYGGNTCGWSLPDNIDSKNGAFITFALVPEPATYALVPAALAIMGLVGVATRRRRSATLPQ